MDSMARDWVPDTAFGRWFLSTDMWLQRVLARAIADLKQLASTNAPEAFIKTWLVRLLFRHPRGVQKPAEGYLDLVRAAGFVFADADVRIWTPWWSLPDLGFTRKLGLVRRPPVATELLVVARKAPG